MDPLNSARRSLAAQIEANNQQYLLREQELETEISKLTTVHDTSLDHVRAQHAALEQQLSSVQQQIAKLRQDRVLAETAVARLATRSNELREQGLAVHGALNRVLQVAQSFDKILSTSCNELAVQVHVKEANAQVATSVAMTPVAASGVVEPWRHAVESLATLAFLIRSITHRAREEAQLHVQHYELTQQQHVHGKRQLQEQAALLLQAQQAIPGVQADLERFSAEISTQENRQEVLISEARARKAELSELGITFSNQSSALGAIQLPKLANTSPNRAFRNQQRKMELEAEDRELQNELETVSRAVQQIERETKGRASRANELKKEVRATEERIKQLERETTRMKLEISQQQEEALNEEQELKKAAEAQKQLLAEKSASERLCEQKRTYLATSEETLAPLLSETARLRSKLTLCRNDATAAQKRLQQVQRAVNEAQIGVDDATNEVLYLQSLLPKRHPSARIATILDEYTAKQRLTPEAVRQRALLNRAQILARAREPTKPISALPTPTSARSNQEERNTNVSQPSSRATTPPRERFAGQIRSASESTAQSQSTIGDVYAKLQSIINRRNPKM